MHHRKPPETAAIDREPNADEIEEAITLGRNGSPQTEFDRLLIAARREFFAAEGRFPSRDELAREVAERRGGPAAVDEE